MMEQQKNNATGPKYANGTPVVYIGTTVGNMLINGQTYEVKSSRCTCCGWVYDVGAGWPHGLLIVKCLDHNTDLTDIYKNVLFVIERYLRPVEDKFAENVLENILKDINKKQILQPCQLN